MRNHVHDDLSPMGVVKDYLETKRPWFVGTGQPKPGAVNPSEITYRGSGSAGKKHTELPILDTPYVIITEDLIQVLLESDDVFKSVGERLWLLQEDKALPELVTSAYLRKFADEIVEVQEWADDQYTGLLLCRNALLVMYIVLHSVHTQQPPIPQAQQLCHDYLSVMC
eukprot:TRINITY_DN20668_c0_g1_i1.p1 TRINITY_DN20668_c0_g1~~TRINITY_DN20668_c0_g1_i1.p1  ORF type:complete len:168 (+),score=15.34 TRINITY_DN20668_c0_g1_i1:138-641(+)